jgi:Ca-activated chloride channel family protein
VSSPSPAVLVVPIALAGCLMVRAQAPVDKTHTDRPFKTGVEVVTITASVVDAQGGPVSGLTRDDFQVFDDGVAQPVTHFSSDRVPVSVGLLLDISDSMFGRRIAHAREAVERFLLELLEPDDEFFVMTFNHAPRLLVPWMHTPDQVTSRLRAARPSGGTAIYDAMMAALPEFPNRSRQRAALVLISDGADTASDASVRDVRTALQRSDAFVYAIAIDPPDRRPINAHINPYALREISDETGGRTEVIHDTSELSDATARIADDLNHQYVLGYAAPRAPDGLYHMIRVKLTRQGLRVRARRGYVAERAGDRSVAAPTPR